MRNTSSFLDAPILSQSTNQARRGSRRRAPDHLIDVVSPQQSLLRARGQKQQRKTGRREPKQRHNQGPQAGKARSALEGLAPYPRCFRFEESREAFFRYLCIGVHRTGGKPFYFYRKASIQLREPKCLGRLAARAIVRPNHSQSVVNPGNLITRRRIKSIPKSTP
jgi:hypothetical protein